MSLSSYLSEVRLRARAMHTEVITDPHSVFWYKVGASQADIKTLLALVDVQRKALETLAAPITGRDAMCGSPVAIAALSECDRIVGEK